jgi:hypothetical protein
VDNNAVINTDGAAAVDDDGSGAGAAADPRFKYLLW